MWGELEVEIHAISLVVLAVLVFTIDGYKYSVQRWAQRMSPQEKECIILLAQLRQQEKKVKSVETFVEHSKLIRHMNQLEKKIQTMAAQRMSAVNQPSPIRTVMSYAKEIVMVVAMIYFWSHPLVQLPKSRIFPFAQPFSIPGYALGSISAPAWCLICSRVSKKLFV